MKRDNWFKIDLDKFSPKPQAKEYLQKKYQLKDGFNLLYIAYRSQTRDLNFLLQIFEALLSYDSHWNLLIIGHSASFNKIKGEILLDKRLIWDKHVEKDILPYIYSGADLLIFSNSANGSLKPVAEAQACGLPVIVSNKGASKKLIEDHRTGLLAQAGSKDSFVEKILFMRKIWETNPHRYAQMKKEARRRFLSINWAKNNQKEI